MWAISTVCTDMVQRRCMKKTCRIKVKTPFQIIYLPNACEANSRNIYIPATKELTNNDATCTLHKCFLGFMMINLYDHCMYLASSKPNLRNCHISCHITV